MAYVLKQIVRLHFYFNDECSDPRVVDWFLMKNPFQTLTIIGLYLAFVLKWGPEFMKNRKPFQLNNLIQVYNAIQVIICGFLVIEAFRLAYFKDYSWICQPVDFSNTPEALAIAYRAYIYFALKILDLLDTVFFILRKKQSQVTFLHVYHHAGMVGMCWTAVKYFPGGHGIFMGSINSFVHVVMYSYYFITSYSPKQKENVWWKKHITQLQLIQFFLIFLHFFILLFQPNCDYPKCTAMFLIPQNVFMFVLFSDFYYKTYLKKKRNPIVPAVKMSVNGPAEATLSKELFINDIEFNKKYVFFILRKKQNQVTFLHVYHHAGMVAMCWAAVKYFPGGHGIFMGSLNSFVHVVMYSYYFVTSYSPKYKENLWWKKHITQLQLVQFFLIFVHFFILLFQPNCDYPKSAAGLLVPQNLFMFVLFSDFYYRTYVRKKSNRVVADAQNTEHQSLPVEATLNKDILCNNNIDMNNNANIAKKSN